MSTELLEATSSLTGETQYATFYVGNLMLGVDIRKVQEINRQVDVTPVPNSPAHVRGVINLRGEVATVIDLRKVLGMEGAEESRDSRNLIVHSQDEAIGLWVDRISDILTVRHDEVTPTPANVDGVDGRFFNGVYSKDGLLVVLLDIEQCYRIATDPRA